jgi:hypothetical protein
MPGKSKQPQIPLPKSWATHVTSAVLHVVALARYALTYSRSWAADSTNRCNQKVNIRVGEEESPRVYGCEALAQSGTSRPDMQGRRYGFTN